MSSIFATQTGNFSYTFGFRTKTGEAPWRFNFIYDAGNDSLFEAPTQIQTITGLGNSAGSVALTNSYLLVGDPHTYSPYTSESDIIVHWAGTPSQVTGFGGHVTVYKNQFLENNYGITMTGAYFAEENTLYGAGLNKYPKQEARIDIEEFPGYRIESWPLIGTLEFGSSISATNDAAVIGAPGSQPGWLTGAGGIFYYTMAASGAETAGIHAANYGSRSGWGNYGGVTGLGEWGQAGLVSGTSVSGRFGCSCALFFQSGTEEAVSSQMVIGAGATGELAGSGRAYVYNARNLVAPSGIGSSGIAPSGSDIANFGKDVEFVRADELTWLGVGYDQGGTGKMDIYKESSMGANDYTYYQTIAGPLAHSGDLFAYNIDSDKSSFIIGAPNAGNSGHVYVCSYNTSSGSFSITQDIYPTDLASGDNFGRSLSFNTGRGVIMSNKNSGKGYLYERASAGWASISVISGTGDGLFGNFSGSGNGVAFEGNDLIVGTNTPRSYYFTTGQLDMTLYTGVSISGSGGKVFDSDHNFLYGYDGRVFTEISGTVFSTGYHNIFINQSLVNSRTSRSTGVGNTGILNSWTVNNAQNLSYYSLDVFQPTS